VEEPPRAEPAIPGGYRKVPPAAADTATDILRQTASIVRGRISAVEFSFDDCAGPRTNYVFSDAKALLGTEVPSRITLPVFGGSTPRGTWLRATEISSMAIGSEYTVFLRSTDWTFSPVVRNLAFRSETIGGREVLVDSDGHLLTGWGEARPVVSAVAVTEAVGHRSRGYSAVDAPARKDAATSATESTDAPRLARGPMGAEARAEVQLRSAGAPAMTPLELARSRLFERPSLLAAPTAVSGTDAMSREALVAAIRKDEERAKVTVGGRLTLTPYWKCWSATPTVSSLQSR
jgi:hypothetical protein